MRLLCTVLLVADLLPACVGGPANPGDVTQAGASKLGARREPPRNEVDPVGPRTGSVKPRPQRSRFADGVNVMDFGAVGDGISDDTQAIQLAVASALASAAGEVVFPYGTYVVSRPISIGTRPGHASAAQLRLYGPGTGGNAGSGAVLKAATRFEGDAVLRFDHGVLPAGGDGAQLSISGLTIDCSSVAPQGIFVNSPIMVTIERVVVLYPRDIGIKLSGGEDGGYSVYLHDIYIYGSDPNHVAHPANYGIFSTARFARYERVVMDGARTGIYYSGDSVTVTGSHLEGQATSIELNTTGRGLTRITGNYINAYGASQRGWPESAIGIRLAGNGPGAALDNFITGNVIISATGAAPVGIYFSNSYRAFVTGNFVDAPVGISTNGYPGPDRYWVLDANVFTGTPVSHNVDGGQIVYSAANITASGVAPSFEGYTRFIHAANASVLEGQAQVNYSVPSLGAASGVTASVTVPGASPGDFVIASFDADLNDVTVSARVGAPDTVLVRFQNSATSGFVGASGTLRVRIIRHE